MSDNAVKEVYELVLKLDYDINIYTHNKTIDESLSEILTHLPKP